MEVVYPGVMPIDLGETIRRPSRWLTLPGAAGAALVSGPAPDTLTTCLTVAQRRKRRRESFATGAADPIGEFNTVSRVPHLESPC